MENVQPPDSEARLKERNERLEQEVERLKKSKGRYDVLLISRDQWKECAQYYAEKFQLACKGFLMTQGKPEFLAHQESLKVLDKIKSLE